MSLYVAGLSCCAIREIAGLAHYDSDPMGALRMFDTQTATNKRFRYVVFSQSRKSSLYGERFADFIKEKGLGEVVDTGFNVNPNTSNQVKVWMWTIDHKAVASLLRPPSTRVRKVNKVEEVEGPVEAPTSIPEPAPSEPVPF